MDKEIAIGQEHIAKHFESAIKLDKVSHSYIIEGEMGMGKTALATYFAKALMCGQKSGVPCGRCKSCHMADAGTHPDIRYVKSEKAAIGVDDIRTQINDDIVIRPYTGKYKVYIVPGGEKLTVQAQNALLKTIEEPPKYAVLILLTTNAGAFLPTILSRCVLLRARPVAQDVICRLLMERGMDTNNAKLIAAFAGGNPGKAESIAESETFGAMKSGVLLTLKELGGGMDGVIKAVNTAKGYKDHAEEYLELFKMWFRDVLLYKATDGNGKIAFEDEKSRVEQMSESCAYKDINGILEDIDTVAKRIKSNVNFEMSMEVLFLAIRERIKQR